MSERGELLEAGLVHEDVRTVIGNSLRDYCTEPFLEGEDVVWKPAPAASGDLEVIRPASSPFAPDGGMRLMEGNLGRAVIKVSAVKPEHQSVEAPAIVFDSQEEFMRAFKDGHLQCDFVAVVRYQGPRANGMPELHALTPALGSLQDAGFRVALVTDGRMSGASGKVPAAIHVSPEVVAGGPLGKVRTGDVIRVNALTGSLQALVDEAEWEKRSIDAPDLRENQVGTGRELFAMFRRNASAAEEGAAIFDLPPILREPVSSEEAHAVSGDMPGSDEDFLARQNVNQQ